MLTCNVSEPWFGHIKSGAKTIEGRLNKGGFREIHEAFLARNSGQLILTVNGDAGDSVKAEIVDVVGYASFWDYLSQEGLARTLPGIARIEEGVDVYREFYKPSQEMQVKAEVPQNAVVLAVHLRVLPSAVGGKKKKKQATRGRR